MASLASVAHSWPLPLPFSVSFSSGHILLLSFLAYWFCFSFFSLIFFFPFGGQTYKGRINSSGHTQCTGATKRQQQFILLSSFSPAVLLLIYNHIIFWLFMRFRIFVTLSAASASSTCHTPLPPSSSSSSSALGSSSLPSSIQHSTYHATASPQPVVVLSSLALCLPLAFVFWLVVMRRLAIKIIFINLCSLHYSPSFHFPHCSWPSRLRIAKKKSRVRKKSKCN